MKINKILLFLFFVIFLSFLLSAQDAPPQKVLQTAQIDLPGLLRNLDPSSRQDFGFNFDDTILKSNLGKVISWHFFNLDSLSNININTSIKSLIDTRIHTPEIWDFPVEYKGEPRVMISVAFNDNIGQWQIVDMGLVRLAKVIDKIRKQWPENKGFHPIFIKMGYKRPKMFFSIPEVDGKNLTSLGIKHSFRYDTLMPSPNYNLSNKIDNEIINDIESHDYSKLGKIYDYIDDINSYVKQRRAEIERLKSQKK
jgi:hypothetical protein